MATASKGPFDARPKAGSTTPLQPVIKASGQMIDTRMAPCGDNQLATPDDDGDEY